MGWTIRTDHQPPPSDSEGDSETPLRTLKIFFKGTSHRTQPTLLDMGSACSSNIEFFGQKGFKIYVEDFLNDYLDAKQKPSSTPYFLNYSPRTFDGILCWDIFEFMTPEDAEILIQRLFTLLKGGGMIMALFDGRTTTQTRNLIRHKIVGEEHVIHETIREVSSMPHHYQNRDIMKLFCTFEIVKSYYHKNRLREYLFQKIPSTVT